MSNEHIEEARRLVAELEAARREKMQNEYSIRTVAAVVGLEVDLGRIAPELLAHIDAQAAELTRLRSLLPTTADGVSIADCPELYCPHCGDKVLQYDRCCVCENCGTDESGTWELEYSETVSKPKETERA